MRYFYQSIYQDTVDALREIFNRLNLIIDGIACVRIADPEILRILKEKLDVDNIGAISEEYIKKLDKDKQEICNQLNRRTEFIVLRTTYGMFDKEGNMKNPPKPKKAEEDNSNDDLF